MIGRRTFLATTAAACTVVPLGLARAAGGLRFLSSVDRPNGGHFFAGFDADGQLLFEHPLPERGHFVALRPQRNEAVIVARRPGRFMVAVDLATGEVAHSVDSPPGRHFFGHAAFAPDGRTLYATENDFDTGAGLIGLYDVDDGYARVAEHPCHGIGPHELALLPDGRTLVVAVTGVLTRPETGRDKLNLDSMAPALVYLDAVDGRLLHRAAMPAALHQLGIHHVDVAADGRVGLSMQHEGPQTDRVPLAAVQQGDGPIELLDIPDPIIRGTGNYSGAVCLDAADRVLAATCPRGNQALFWDLADCRFLGRVATSDGCAVAASELPGSFVVSNGTGGILAIDALAEGGPVARPVAGGDAENVYWDNHLALLGD